METTVQDVLKKVEQLEREIKNEIEQINRVLFGDVRNRDYPGMQARLSNLSEKVEEIRKCTEKLTELTALQTVVKEIKEYVDSLKTEKKLNEQYQKRLWQWVIFAMTLVSILGPTIGLGLANALKGLAP